MEYLDTKHEARLQVPGSMNMNKSQDLSKLSFFICEGCVIHKD